jgi:hypothetical protein
VALPHVYNEQAYNIYVKTFTLSHASKNGRITDEYSEGKDLEGKIAFSVKVPPRTSP